MRARAWLLAASLLAAGLPAGAIAADVSVAPGAAAPASLPREGIVLRGTLGESRVQMQLRPKPDEDEGIEGEYFAFGQGNRILLAGEMDAEGFWMEESANGTDVSGQWEGQRRGDTLSGTWRSADGKLSLPFSVQSMPAPAARKSR